MGGRRTTSRAVCVAGLAAALLGTALAQGAGAQGPGFSFTPSVTEPYAACGRATPGHSACLAILVPSTETGSLSGQPQVVGPLAVSRTFPGSGVGGGYDPADLKSAYNLPSGSAGTGETVAIVDAFDDPNAEADLAKYRARYGLSACAAASGCFKKVNQAGGSSPPTANAGWAVEVSLDLDMVSAACPNCHLLLVEANNNENGNLFAAEDQAVALGATEVTNSWAGEEYAEETSADAVFNHPGVPITASAGDNGFAVEYPAASPYVIAVGGTALTPASNSRGWSETAWKGTGSGCSAFEAKPGWQTDTGCAKRTNVDVAAVAAPETPLSVADSYKLPPEFAKPEAGWTLVAGTSASSPLVAGMMALANAFTRSFPGAEGLYREAAQSPTGTLDDVTSGNNVKEKHTNCGTYLCNAGVGYDGPTGLGSPYGAPVVLPNPPSAVTKPASSVAQVSATLNATVNPNSGDVGECKFEYGATVSYGKTAACTPTPGSGSSPVAVSASVAGLAAGSTYHFRIVAVNAGGRGEGGDESFATSPALSAPTVLTGTGSSVTASVASVNGSVNPNNGQLTDCRFEYGTTISYGSSVPCRPLPGSGTSAVAVSAPIGGLAASSTYHFRISATNSAGKGEGSDQTFTTPAAAHAHWYENSVRMEEGGRVPFMSWGTLALTSSKGGAATECQTAVGGYLENPSGAVEGAFEREGVETIEAFNLYNCTNAECEAEGGKAGVLGEELPWLVGLSEAVKGTFRLASTGVQLFVHCQTASSPASEKPGSGPYTGLQERTSVEYNAPGAMTCTTNAGGSLRPRVSNGVSAGAPSKIVFSAAGGGELECAGAGKLSTTGSLKTIGYQESELLLVRSP
jgi:hypothetical protein